MKKIGLLFKLFMALIALVIGANSVSAQTTDTVGLFNPALSARHIVYSELMLYDVDEDGNFDAAFVLSQDTVKVWDDYSTSLAFYDEGFKIRNGGGFTSSNTIIPVAGEITKVWTAVDVANMTYKTYVQVGTMEYPELVYNGDAAFRNTAITALNYWSTLHNANSEPDSVAVKTIEFQTSSDATLRSVTANIGTIEYFTADQEYVLTVPYGTTEVTMDVVANGIGANVQISDGDVVYENGVVAIPSESDGIDLYIWVDAFDGTQNEYILTINVDQGAVNPNLSDIQLSTGRLTATFDANVTEYTAFVPYGTSSVIVTGVPTWSGANVAGDGEITLTDGVGTATIVVTSQTGGFTNTYIVNVFESEIRTGQDFYIEQELSGFVMGAGVTLQAAAKDEPTQLWQIEASGVDNQYFIKNKNNQYLSHSSSTYWNLLMRDNLTENLDSCRFVIEEFEPGKTRIASVIKAEEANRYIATDGTAIGNALYSNKAPTNERGVWVFKTADQVFPRDAYLVDLSVNDLSLYPSFGPSKTDYHVTLPAGTNSVMIGATAEENDAVITGTGTVSTSANTGMFTISVTTADGLYTKIYTIEYIKDTPLTLMHSYTFADGTAEDMVGTANGYVVGGNITDGIYMTETLGDYIEFPAAEIAINTYPTITFEYFIASGANETTNTMLSFFGDNINTYGVNGVFTATKSRAAISCLNEGAPWNAESGVDGASIENGEFYHVVTVLTNETISMYIRGSLVGTANLSDDNKIYNLSNELAYLCNSGYDSDATWLGSVYEFNIYSGIMTEQEAQIRYFSYNPATSVTDATLSDLTVDGLTIEGFNPANLNYVVSLEDGASVPTISGTAKVSGAIVSSVSQAGSFPGVATIEVTAADGVTKNTYTVEFEVATGIGKAAKEGAVKVYPTVSSGEFTVEMEGMSSVISVYDLAGGLVKQVKSNAKSEIISIDQNGMYIVKVEVDGVSELFKVFKK
ncbi:cadherin-like beta sandwich domain-containing protein [Carboxylicivirga caseinilyticus]|uniref:cadherin-like beta sandwich domain-containing protein n=1 Tax=Carboxylicivirga caseinilyticus TaxID=3417572 RepID=UPI003D33E0BE|nr:T9SS type A sorting domain-containing protein [Marinilabiliaceae bacterium A049]